MRYKYRNWENQYNHDLAKVINNKKYFNFYKFYQFLLPLHLRFNKITILLILILKTTLEYDILAEPN